MSAWVKKRKIWVKSERSCSVNFCAQSRQSSPKGTSSGIQWICCWRFQNSNAQGYSNGLYCLEAVRRDIGDTPGRGSTDGVEKGDEVDSRPDRQRHIFDDGEPQGRRRRRRRGRIGAERAQL